MSEIQSIRFKKLSWNTAQARRWMKLHDFLPLKKVDIGKNWLRYRIKEPVYEHYITKKLDNDIELVIGFY